MFWWPTRHYSKTCGDNNRCLMPLSPTVSPTRIHCIFISPPNSWGCLHRSQQAYRYIHFQKHVPVDKTHFSSIRHQRADRANRWHQNRSRTPLGSVSATFLHIFLSVPLVPEERLVSLWGGLAHEIQNNREALNHTHVVLLLKWSCCVMFPFSVVCSKENALPSTVSYGMSDILRDLLDFSARFLHVGGRLVFWLPVHRAE